MAIGKEWTKKGCREQIKAKSVEAVIFNIFLTAVNLPSRINFLSRSFGPIFILSIPAFKTFKASVAALFISAFSELATVLVSCLLNSATERKNKEKTIEQINLN